MGASVSQVSYGSYVSFYLTTALLMMAIGGLYLLVSGLRGRRVGDEPRCRKCGYILLHLASRHCPECGGEISDDNTVIGQRKRRPWRAVAGIVLLLLTVAPMISPVVSAFDRIPWYQYKPIAFVLDDLDGSATYAKAMKELQRREQAGGLSEAMQQKLIQKALQDQISQTPVRQELLDYLGTTIMDGRVTQRQKDRFLDQVCTTSMGIRSIVVEGDQVPYRITGWPRGPGGMFWIEYSCGVQLVDGKTAGTGQMSSTGPLTSQIGAFTSATPSGAVGKHVLEVDVASSIWFGPRGEREVSQLIGKRTMTPRRNYEVLPRGQAPEIELLDSEDLRYQVPLAVKLTSVDLQKNGHVVVNFGFSDAPCNLAFDVLMVTQKGETKVGSIYCDRGHNTGFGIGVNFPDIPARVKIILRSSAEAARRTIDLTSIYAGDIVFEDVVVEQRN